MVLCIFLPFFRRKSNHVLIAPRVPITLGTSYKRVSIIYSRIVMDVTKISVRSLSYNRRRDGEQYDIGVHCNL